MTTIHKKKSLLTIANNSIKGGDNYLFRNLYVEDDKGNIVDVLEDGGNSCAAFVSWILLGLGLIKLPHATVDSTVKDLLNNGLQEIKEPKAGAVLLWEKLAEHRHIGFYAGNGEAISNDSRGSRFPRKHHYTYNNTRKIDKIYWHPELDEDE